MISFAKDEDAAIPNNVSFSYSQEFLPFDVFAPFLLFQLVRFDTAPKIPSEKPTSVEQRISYRDLP